MNFRSRHVFIFASLCLFHWQAEAAEYGINLVANGSAEEGPFSPTGAPVDNIPGWTTTNGLTVVNYKPSDDLSGFPKTSDPGPDERGNQFFAGGSAETGSGFQDVDVSANAADIDGGNVLCDVSAWLGGYADQDDQAVFTVTFKKDAFTNLGSVELKGPNASDRDSKTALIPVSDTVGVPAGTKSIHVVVIMTRLSAAGSANDGYADALSVVLRAPVVVTNTNDSGPGSLRAAISTGSVITFDPNVFSSGDAPHFINLSSRLGRLSRRTSIIGPGANVVTLKAASSGYGIFYIFPDDGLRSVLKINLSGVTLADAASQSSGGALFNARATVFVTGCAFVDNSGSDGGAIGNFAGTMTLSGCTFSGNNSLSGAISTAASTSTSVSTLTATNCTFSGNTGPSDGGAIQTKGQGGGTAETILHNCTFSGNSGALRSYAPDLGSHADVTLDNTILNSSSKAMVAYDGGTFTSEGYNLSNGDDSAILKKAGDRNDTDPMLDVLKDNGGPTLTHALLPGSFAIDKGNSDLAVDQRGAPRPIDDVNSANGGGNDTDIGAFEFASTVPTPTPSPSPTATVTPTPTATPTATPTPGQALNISTRLRVLTGAKVLIGGFFITGTDAKTVIIRARGPSLATSEGPVSGRMSNPTLELHDGNPPQPIIASNDDWKVTPDGTSQQSEIEASGFAPAADSESAILVTLQPGPYTAILRGKDDEEGIGLVEVYDLSSGSSSRLGNISTRGFVDAGDNVMIGGFFVGPENGTSAKLVIRAIGPSLSGQGVEGAMDDPTVTLYNLQGTVIGENDNWSQDAGAGEIEADHLQPGDSRESATLQTLPPGGYTAIVRGAGGTTGVALVEVYALQ